MKALKLLISRIDALSLRERVAVFVAVAIAIFFVWDSVYMQPLQRRLRQVETEISQKSAEKTDLMVQIDNLKVRQQTDPNELNRQKLRELKKQLGDIEQQLQDSASRLISPTEMASLLESVLLRVGGVRLVSVRGLGSAAVITMEGEENTIGGEPAPKTATNIENAYRHGLRIEFEGSYMSTLEYVRELESLQWGFFWDSLELTVNEYPDSTVVITVYTLSLDRNWIGV